MAMTPEQFAEKQARELAAFKAEQELAARIEATGIPMPDYFNSKLYGAQCLTYRNDRTNPRTLRAALEMFKGFTIVPANVLRRSCTIIAPEKDLPERQKNEGYKRDDCRNGGDYAAIVDVQHIQDSPAPTAAKLSFYARAGGMLLNVSIEFGSGYIGSCPGLTPKRREERGANGRLVSARFEPNAVMNGAADSVLSYGSGDMGPIKKSSDHRFLFIAENGPDDISGAVCAHAIAQTARTPSRNWAQSLTISGSNRP